MPRLLIIDDDSSMRNLLRSRLQDSYEIIDTLDAEEGIVLALQQKPDAILLDLMMPRYSGFEVCQTLSSMSFTRGIPLFIVSGESSERYRDFCLNLGAKAFFEKPVDFAALRKELAAVIGGNNHARRAEARVRIRVALKLCGIDLKGVKFELVNLTENVTAHGFLCGCRADVKEGAVVEVYLPEDGQKFVGKARIVRVDSPGTHIQRCEFEFVEKPADWVLP
ncbi:MAG: response regulator [Candidatus Acidiferrales bacterium]|jgi:DNA-binding response OmpR family regulator